MALWVAGISAHPKAFPKSIDKGRDDPQLRMNLSDNTTRAIQTREMQHRSRSALWMTA